MLSWLEWFASSLQLLPGFVGGLVKLILFCNSLALNCVFCLGHKTFEISLVPT